MVPPPSSTLTRTQTGSDPVKRTVKAYLPIEILRLIVDESLNGETRRNTSTRPADLHAITQRRNETARTLISTCQIFRQLAWNATIDGTFTFQGTEYSMNPALLDKLKRASPLATATYFDSALEIARTCRHVCVPMDSQDEIGVITRLSLEYYQKPKNRESAKTKLLSFQTNGLPAEKQTLWANFAATFQDSDTTIYLIQSDGYVSRKLLERTLGPETKDGVVNWTFTEVVPRRDNVAEIVK